MAGMRAWCATLALVALATLPVGRGFAPAAAPAARALRGGNGRRPGGRACASGAASLRAILDKIPLPQSPRPSEIMKSLENKEVRRGVCVCVCVCVCVLIAPRAPARRVSLRRMRARGCGRAFLHRPVVPAAGPP